MKQKTTLLYQTKGYKAKRYFAQSMYDPKE